VACAAALATLEIMEEQRLPEKAAQLGEYALGELRKIQSPLIREVRGQGLLLGIEIKQKVAPYLAKMAERGVLALPAGMTVIRLLPPLVISKQQLDRVIAVVKEVLT
jgi:acetylornithine/LysW-gamma-L-lysine aminotransferase